MSVKSMRLNLMSTRRAHGANSAIGLRCSNIIQLIQRPNPPAHLIDKQMRDLKQLLNDLQ